jgi:predicted metal-dependent hydrolase
MDKIHIDEVEIAVEKKNIKNIHLSVYPPLGAVRISVPNRIEDDEIRMFALRKLGWIKKQQKKFREQERETPREFISAESHYFKGERYLLELIESSKPPSVSLKHKKILLQVRPNASLEKKQSVMDEWYRDYLKRISTELIQKWENIMGVKSNELGIKKMRTRWGTCNTQAKRIWLNLELAKKPVNCLEFVIVHELVHLLERSHNKRFIGFMDKFMPNWRHHRDELNQLPFRHSDWKY